MLVNELLCDNMWGYSLVQEVAYSIGSSLGIWSCFIS